MHFESVVPVRVLIGRSYVSEFSAIQRPRRPAGVVQQRGVVAPRSSRTTKSDDTRILQHHGRRSADQLDTHAAAECCRTWCPPSGTRAGREVAQRAARARRSRCRLPGISPTPPSRARNGCATRQARPRRDQMRPRGPVGRRSGHRRWASRGHSQTATRDARPNRRRSHGNHAAGRTSPSRVQVPPAAPGRVPSSPRHVPTMNVGTVVIPAAVAAGSR